MDTQTELMSRLHEQRELLRSSIRVIDSGTYVQLLSAAVTVRTLVHDTNSSHSLLQQLGLKESMTWLAFPTLRDGIGGYTMLDFRFNEGIDIYPYTDTSQLTPCDFETWWHGVPLRGGGAQVGRKDVVLTLANNEGGGHVEIDGRFTTAARASAPQLVHTDENGVETVTDEIARPLVFMLMRSILTEVDFTLTRLLHPGEIVTPKSSSMGVATVDLAGPDGRTAGG